MDLRTGKTYNTREDAIKDNVPPSDIFDTRTFNSREEANENLTKKGLIVGIGPFKDRIYKRDSSGNLVKVGKLQKHRK